MAQDNEFDRLLAKEFTSTAKEIDPTKSATTLSKVDATGQLLKSLHNNSQTGIINYADGGSGDFVKRNTTLGFNLREIQGKVILAFDPIPDGLSRGDLGRYQDAMNVLNKTLGERELNSNDVSQLSGKSFGKQVTISEKTVMELSEKLKADQHEVNQIVKAFISGDESQIKHTLMVQQAVADTSGSELLNDLLKKETKPNPHREQVTIDSGKSDFEKLMQNNSEPSAHSGLASKAGQIADEASLTHGTKKLGWVGSAFILAGAVTQAKEAEASVPEKIGIFANKAVDAVPFVTFAKNMSEEKYKEAAVDAASYLPSGIMTAFAREPKVQAVIDALPEDREQLNNMLHKPKTPYIDRHLAEYRLQYLDAEEKGNLLDGIGASNKLTELAEKKLELQAQWKKDADTFEAATKNPETNWREFAKNNPDLAAQTATHIAAMNDGRPQAFINSMDENLIKNTANGIPFEGKVQIQAQVQVHEANTSEKMQLTL